MRVLDARIAPILRVDLHWVATIHPAGSALHAGANRWVADGTLSKWGVASGGLINFI
jgi:hypothetical protein